MIKFKTLKGLCNWLSQANQQDKLQKLEHRYIFRASSFSEKDNNEISENKNALEKVIKMGQSTTKNYDDFKILINECKKILPYMFLGTSEQQSILKFLPNCKI